MIRVDDILQERRTLSFEFFPPKKETQFPRFYSVVEELSKLKPDFISVTYGAGGGNRERTMEITHELQSRFSIPTTHHLTCVGNTRKELEETLDLMEKNGIFNLLALRGDLPEGETEWKGCPDSFQHAYQLCEMVQAHNQNFSCGVAGFPEMHPESVDRELDLKYMKEKVEAGGDYVMTQFFFENHLYFDYIDALKDMGLNIKVIPGIMPVTNFVNLKKDDVVYPRHMPFPKSEIIYGRSFSEFVGYIL